jgi:insulysin
MARNANWTCTKSWLILALPCLLLLIQEGEQNRFYFPAAALSCQKQDGNGRVRKFQSSPQSCDKHCSDECAWPERREFLQSCSAGTSAAVACASWSTPEGAVARNVVAATPRRRYQTKVLRQGMQVLLVSDPAAISASPLAGVALTIRGAGQFHDPSDLPGCAHLMEHLVLSSPVPNRHIVDAKNSSLWETLTFPLQKTLRDLLPEKNRDFEEWLSDHDGESNAFTAYDYVCFHFSCPLEVLPEALVRFAHLFTESHIRQVCSSDDLIHREVLRVHAELDFDNPLEQSLYLTKALTNIEHPYAHFSRGSLATLEEQPRAAQENMGQRLWHFFQSRYQPRAATLVVTAPQEDISTLERLVEPFSTTLSSYNISGRSRRFFPGGFLAGNRPKHLVLYRKANRDSIGQSRLSDEVERMSFEWPLNLDYRKRQGDTMSAFGASTKYQPTATEVAFILAQVLGRRGPGSLYQFLLRRGWTTTTFPRITLPLDVSGFQIVRLDLMLTPEGFYNRAAVAAAVFGCIETLRGQNDYLLSRQLLAQYVNMAKLHGHWLAPRLPDAVELAVDAQMMGGFDTDFGVGSGRWYRTCSSLDRNALKSLQNTMADVLRVMSDPVNSIIQTTATDKLLASDVPSVHKAGESRWLMEPVSGARFYYDDILGLPARLEELLLTTIVDRQELFRPVVNPLLPATIFLEKTLSTGGRRPWRSFELRRSSQKWSAADPPPARSSTRRAESTWILLVGLPNRINLLLPRTPQKSYIRSAFVLQLLSSRPARADVREAARAELWKLSFEAAISDLAEVGVSCGLAYEMSFNKYGIRISFLGLKQNLPSYARRFCRRLVQHNLMLLNGPERFPSQLIRSALAEARTNTELTPQRRLRIISNLRAASAYEVAGTSTAFLRSVRGAMCYAEGNFGDKDARELCNQLEEIFDQAVGPGDLASVATPSLYEILYRPLWRPRYGSSCFVAGVPLISDACGRVLR